MSFDLYVWYESGPISADEARAKLERWGDDEAGVFAAYSAVGSFYAALIDRFPPLESFSAADIDRLGVWSVTPERSDEIVAASCVWSRADEVGTAVVVLAAEYGLVCYEPGYHIVNPNTPGYVAAFTLTSASLPMMPDPDGRRLEWIMSKVGRDNEYATLERADGWFVQVGYGEFAGVPNGSYALEYREGSIDRHFRCETTDRTAAVRCCRSSAQATTPGSGVTCGGRCVPDRATWLSFWCRRSGRRPTIWVTSRNCRPSQRA